MTITSVKQRIFLVGCGRSGTTLLQCLIAAHSDIFSIPESKFFQYLIPTYEPRRLMFGLTSQQFYPWIIQFCEDMGHPELASSWSKYPLPIAWQAEKFVHDLDRITRQSGYHIWLEKSPKHLHYLKYVERYVPDVKIIHLVRSGTDVVASLYDAARKYPQKWGYEHGTIEQCVQRWLTDIQVTQQYLAKPNHTLVRYESLVANPEQSMRDLCDFLAIPFEPTMLEDYKVTAQPLMKNRYENCEPAVTEQIQNANSTKFFTLFSEEEQAYIQEKLAGVDLEHLSAIAA